MATSRKSSIRKSTRMNANMITEKKMAERYLASLDAARRRFVHSLSKQQLLQLVAYCADNSDVDNFFVDLASGKIQS